MKVSTQVHAVFLTLSSLSVSAFAPKSTTTSTRSTSSSSSSKTTRKSARFVAKDPPPLFVDETRANVQDYYGKNLQSSDDLQTNACCTAGAPPDYIQECISNLHPTTVAKYYGCGLCLPNYDLEGATVLDLGCGAGRDVYIASQLVGATGHVTGMDMTDEQLATAREFQSHHADTFGYSNTNFVKGYLESLGDSGLEKESYDLIISNCVINLCADKEAVLKACYDLLKPGGEMYFSDVYANRRVPMSLQKNPLLWGECLSGALYWNDFQNLAKRCGFDDPRLVEDAPITIKNKNVQAMITNEGQAGLEFYSATYRLCKLPGKLEPACEDYGQAVVYKGTIPRAASGWLLDKHHYFEQGRVHPVCGNTWHMLAGNPRLKDHFEYIGDFSCHYGIFEGCGSALPYDAQSNTADGTTTSSKGASCC